MLSIFFPQITSQRTHFHFTWTLNTHYVASSSLSLLGCTNLCRERLTNLENKKEKELDQKKQKVCFQHLYALFLLTVTALAFKISRATPSSKSSGLQGVLGFHHLLLGYQTMISSPSRLNTYHNDMEVWQQSTYASTFVWICDGYWNVWSTLFFDSHLCLRRWSIAEEG